MVVGPLLSSFLLDEPHDVEHGLRHTGEKVANRAGSVARQPGFQFLGHNPTEFEECGTLGRPR